MENDIVLKGNKLFVVAQDLMNYEKLSEYVGGGKDGVVYVVEDEEYMCYYSTKQNKSTRIDLYDLEVNGLKGVVMTSESLNLLQKIKNHVFVDCIMRQIKIYMPLLIDNNGNEIDYLHFRIQ